MPKGPQVEREEGESRAVSPWAGVGVGLWVTAVALMCTDIRGALWLCQWGVEMTGGQDSARAEGTWKGSVGQSGGPGGRTADWGHREDPKGPHIQGLSGEWTLRNRKVTGCLDLSPESLVSLP